MGMWSPRFWAIMQPMCSSKRTWNKSQCSCSVHQNKGGHCSFFCWCATRKTDHPSGWSTHFLLHQQHFTRKCTVARNSGDAWTRNQTPSKNFWTLRTIKNPKSSLWILRLTKHSNRCMLKATLNSNQEGWKSTKVAWFFPSWFWEQNGNFSFEP